MLKLSWLLLAKIPLRTHFAARLIVSVLRSQIFRLNLALRGLNNSSWSTRDIKDLRKWLLDLKRRK